MQAGEEKKVIIKEILTVRSIFLQMDFDLLQCQPSVLVHAEVVQNFGRRFSVRIFHLAGAKERGGASDDQVEMHVVEIHLLWQSGWERGRERTRGGGGS